MKNHLYRTSAAALILAALTNTSSLDQAQAASVAPISINGSTISQESNKAILPSGEKDIPSIKSESVRKDKLIYDGSGNVLEDIKKSVNANVESNLLGIAQNFHIFANEASLLTHTNGNVAIKDLKNGNSNFGTNIRGNSEWDSIMDISYIQNFSSNISPSSIVSARPNKFVVGSTAELSLMDNNNAIGLNGMKLDHATNAYQDKNSAYIDFESEFFKLAGISRSLAEDVNARQAVLNKYGDSYTLDLSNVIAQNNNIILNVSAAELSGNAGDLRIIGLKPGTIIIINLDLKGYTEYNFAKKVILSYEGVGDRYNHAAVDFSDANLLWNFTDSTNESGYTGKIHLHREFQGTILATGATLSGSSNIDGSIIVDKFMGSGATHRWDFQGTNTSSTVPGNDGDPSTPGDNENPSDPGDNENPSTPGDNENPSDPGDHENPSDPGDHENPSDPGDHENPSDPGDHENPSDPGDHENPSDPGDHENPSDPGDHENPSDPGDHENPSDPGDHENPSDPGDHENPSDPGDHENPSDPGDHENPSDPGDHENPSDPGDHENPSDPGDHENPSDPGDNENPSDPGDHENPSDPGDNENPSDPGEYPWPNY